MALVNYATREINAKVVYYGPGLSGKTTNIQYVFQRVKPKNKGKLISLSTQGDRTLFFDFLPVELGEIKGFKTRFHLYTVPGQVFYNSTRKLVLKGADGVVFVADSQKMMMEENRQSLENLKANLRELGIKSDGFPINIQYNKRDLEGAASLEELNGYLNPMGLPWFEASAIKGEGVLQTLTATVKSILQNLKHESTSGDLLSLESIEDEPLPLSGAQEEDAVKIKVQEPLHREPEHISEPSIVVPPTAPDAASTNTASEGPVLPEAEPEEVCEAEVPGEAVEPEATAGVRQEPENGHEDTVPLLELDEPDFEISGTVEAEELSSEGPLPEMDISEFGKTDFHVEELIAKEHEEGATEEPVSFGEAPEAAASPAPDTQEPVKDSAPSAAAEEEAKAFPKGPRTAQSFVLPVRVRTLTGVKEVTLKVNVEIELSGEEIEDISAVEVLRPIVREPYSPPPYPPSGKAGINADERLHRAPVKPKADMDKDKKPNMFQKIFLGMK